MTRLAAGLEGLDDEHAAAAAGAGVCEQLCRIGLASLLGCRWVRKAGTVAIGLPADRAFENEGKKLCEYLVVVGHKT